MLIFQHCKIVKLFHNHSFHLCYLTPNNCIKTSKIVPAFILFMNLQRLSSDRSLAGWRWSLRPRRCRGDTQRNKYPSELLALTDVVVLPEDERTVMGRDPRAFMWHVWADCTWKVEGGTDREWHLFFSRQPVPVGQRFCSPSDKGWCDVTDISTVYIQNDTFVFWHLTECWHLTNNTILVLYDSIGVKKIRWRQCSPI